MLRRIVLIALVAGLALLALVDATPYAQGAARQTPSASLDEKLSAAVARGDVPGLVVDGRHQGSRGLQRRLRQSGGRPRTSDDRGRDLPDRLDDQAGHLGRRDAAVRTGPVRPRRSGGEILFPSWRTSRCSNRSTPPPAPIGCGRRRPRSRFGISSPIRRGSAYGFTSAIDRDFKPREGEQYAAGPLLFEPGTDWMYGTQRRLARAAGREAFRQESRGLLPRAHLHAAGDGRHVL